MHSFGPKNAPYESSTRACRLEYGFNVMVPTISALGRYGDVSPFRFVEFSKGTVPSPWTMDIAPRASAGVVQIPQVAVTERNLSTEPCIIGGDYNVCDKRCVAGGDGTPAPTPKYLMPPWERCRPPVASCSTYAWLSGAPSDPVLQGGEIRENVVLHVFFCNRNNIIGRSHVEPSKSVDIVINYFEGERLHPTPSAGGATKSRQNRI